jgi:hypothetical protein
MPVGEFEVAAVSALCDRSRERAKVERLTTHPVLSVGFCFRRALFLEDLFFGFVDFVYAARPELVF